MVSGLCRGLLRDPTEAEDAAQQVFLSAHRALLNGAEPREPAAWLSTIARNECWGRIGSRMRQPLPSDGADDVPGDDDPVAEAIRNADLAALWRAIRALPRTQREALLLREFGGLRYDELAVALAVSEPAIESLLHRARSRLRTQLEAAYAALTGASWIEALARLLAGGGAPAVATKAAVIGLGAAAVTGGAVVAPAVLTHHPQHTPPAAVTTTARPAATEAAVQLPLPVATSVVRRAPAAPLPQGHEGDSQRHDAPTGDGGSGDGRPGETSGRATTEARDGEHVTTTGSGRDRGGSREDSSGGTGDGSGSDSGSGSGSDSGSQSDDGGSDGGGGDAQSQTTPEVATTVSLPVVTVPIDGGDG